MKPKTIQIEYDLFLSIVEYFFQEKNELTEDDIIKGLTSKIDKIITHETFSKYKKAPEGEERERLRKEYLDRMGMFNSYRTEEEWHEPEPPEDL